MYRESDFKKAYYKTGEVAGILNVTTKTVQNYDRNGTLRFIRSSTDRRMLSRENLIEYLKSIDMIEADERQDVIYACADGKDAAKEMDRQVLNVVTNVAELRNQVIIRDEGKSSDDDRPGFNQLLEMVKNRQVRRVYISEKRILSEFGYKALCVMFNGYDVEIVSIEE